MHRATKEAEERKIKTKSSRVNNSTQHQRQQQHQQENKCETTIKAKMGTARGEKKERKRRRRRRRCRQQTKRRLEKIADARAATLIVRLLFCAFPRLCVCDPFPSRACVWEVGVCVCVCQTSAKQETNLSYFAFTFL